MEKIVAIGPYTPQMKQSIARYLPEDITLSYVTEYGQYGILTDADYILLRTLRMDREHIAQLKQAKLIQRWGAGYDTVDLRAAAEKNIQVAVAHGVNAQSVAELTVALILAVYRNLIPQAQAFAEGKEDMRSRLSATSRCISGKTVGIFGMGNIGRKTAAIVRAFGASVLYYDVYPMEASREQALGVTYGDVDAILAEADIICLHLPLTDATQGFICEDSLAKMKEGALLVNTARQELVDEKALADFLRRGKLAGAGLDELAEPYAESPFAGMANVICTPHIGGSTSDINDAMAKICMEHIAAVRAGYRIAGPDLVNGDLLDQFSHQG